MTKHKQPAVSMPLLSVSGLALWRDMRCLLQDFSLSLQRGECVLLAGANGSGKCSLLNAVCGLVPTEQGRIEWLGQQLAHADRSQWHYLAHADALKAEFSVWENLRFQAALCGVRLDVDATQPVLQQLGLTGLMHRPAGQLSQGQKRRTALLHLRLLPFRPVWLLDEPFNSLDREARTTLSTWMNAHRAQGGALLFTNHFELPPDLLVDRVVSIGDWS